MQLDQPAAFTLKHSAEWSNIVDATMSRLTHEEGLPALRTAGWLTRTSMWDLESLDVICSYSHADHPGGELLLRMADGIVQLYGRGSGSIGVRIVAPTQEEAIAIEEELRELLPEHRQETGWDGKISIRMWSIGDAAGAGGFARTLDVPMLDEIEGNYAHTTLRQLQFLRSFEPPPTNGRLVLMHGPPGTGKSHAVLSMGAEWREWADLHLITDPENMFRDPNYLLTVMGSGQSWEDSMEYVDPDAVDELSRRRRRARDRHSGRWKIIVLEDAGEFMSLQARAETGQALSRLLNMTDGIIGTASRSMLVITTNEKVGDLHPAVSRPGRCHLALDFKPLDADRIAEWCDEHGVDEVPRAQRMTIAELYAWKRGERPVPEEQVGFGFAA